MAGFSVAFHPTQDIVLGFRRFQGLKTSTAGGAWQLLPNQPAALGGDLHAAAVVHDDSSLAVGTWALSSGAIHVRDASTGNWSTPFPTGNQMIIRLVGVRGATGGKILVAATSADVVAYDLSAPGQGWISIGGARGLPTGAVLGLAGASDVNGYILFATVFGGGQTTVWRYSSARGAWSPAMGTAAGVAAEGVAGSLAAGPGNYYEHLAMAPSDTRTVYLSAYLPPNLSPPNVFVTTDGGGSWTSVYDGYRFASALEGALQTQGF